jgi:hypothetical protein
MSRTGRGGRARGLWSSCGRCSAPCYVALSRAEPHNLPMEPAERHISHLTTQERLCAAAHNRSKHKNDRNDAERLAKLLYLGEAPAAEQVRGSVG